MKRLILLPLFILTVTIVGCGGGGSEDNIFHFTPELEGFHLVDSYGFSSEDNPGLLLALNPFVSDGLFEVYWYVDAIEDYTVELRINDRPSFIGSRLISNDYCGIDLPCDQEGLMFCEYGADFSIFCDPADVEAPGIYLTYVDDWMFTLPETLYLLLEVCDTVTDSCEFEVMDVLLE